MKIINTQSFSFLQFVRPTKINTGKRINCNREDTKHREHIKARSAIARRSTNLHHRIVYRLADGWACASGGDGDDDIGVLLIELAAMCHM